MSATGRIKEMTLHEVLGLLLFLAATAASSVTWYKLAIKCEFPEFLAAVPAISLDLGGLYYGTNWIKGRTARLRGWGQATTILAVLVSVAGNAAGHAVEAGLLKADLPLVLAVGSVPAAALFAVAHQWALANAPARPGGKAGKTPPVKVADKVADKVAERAPENVQRVADKVAERVAPSVAAAAMNGAAVNARADAPAHDPAPRPLAAIGGKRATALAYARTNWKGGTLRAAELRRAIAPVSITFSEAGRVLDMVAEETGIPRVRGPVSDDDSIAEEGSA